MSKEYTFKLEYKQLEEIIFGKTGFRRFTQDSPILPDVWVEFGNKPTEHIDLLLTPVWGVSPGTICRTITKRLNKEQATDRWKKAHGNNNKPASEIAYNASTVVVKLYFDELIRVVLPLTNWWKEHIHSDKDTLSQLINNPTFRKKDTLSQLINNPTFRKNLANALTDTTVDSDETFTDEPVWDINRASKHKVWGNKNPKLNAYVIWLMKIAGAISLAGKTENTKDLLKNASDIIETFADLMRDIKKVEKDECNPVWGVNLNRKASAMIWRSTNAVKADAARRLFEVNCEKICWAVIDSGIDAEHPAFRKRDSKGNLFSEPFVNKDGKPQNMTRVSKTYDFTLIRKILCGDTKKLPEQLKNRFENNPNEKKDLQKRLKNGLAIDWATLSPFLEIPHEEGKYESPKFEHGTHVAGILAADWRKTDRENEKGFDIQGVCPDLQLFDLRVLDENGESDEFSILAALQFAHYLNSSSDYMKLHGINLSLSIRHKVKNFACGCTPVCEEAERLVKAGLIIVAAAGNDGYLESEVIGGGFSEGYRSISITDPGNAESVITVGSTHRDSPHTYGVSYFSSRGPTGDGRIKPDLVAPGEKISSTVPENGIKLMDGTSMAAPHVSGAAALLIARYTELIGKPERVKQILCETATDLGRERYFQGSGMLDILRAMQSV